MKREELINSWEYQLDQMQNELYRKTQTFMDDNKMSQMQLANILGCSLQTLSSVLDGKFDGKLSTYCKICTILDNYTSSKEIINNN